MKRILFTLCWLAWGCGSNAPSGGLPDGGARLWRRHAQLAGGPRQETAVVAAAGRIYVLGGFDGAGNVVATVEAYDPATDQWASVAPLPEALHHVNAAAVGDRIYVVGANRGLNFTAVPSSYVYDPTLDQWSPREPLPIGQERGASAVAAIGGKIYVAGGLRGGTGVADVSAYDTVTNTWETLPSLPEGRDHLAGAAVGDIFYAIGGRRGGIATVRNRVDAFDPATGQWTARAPLPTARAGIAGGVLDGRIYIVGGEGNRASPSGVFPQTEAYDPVTDRWTLLEPMLTPRHGTGAAVLGGRLYVPGGATTEGFGAVGVHESFAP
jgi:N-acetylneuraminic acid mutarotase